MSLRREARKSEAAQFETAAFEWEASHSKRALGFPRYATASRSVGGVSPLELHAAKAFVEQEANPLRRET